MADYLVTQGVPFRTAHVQVGQTVRFAETQGKELADLTLEEIKQFAPLAEADLFGWLQIEQSVNRRCSPVVLPPGGWRRPWPRWSRNWD